MGGRLLCSLHLVCCMVCLWTFIGGLFPNAPRLIYPPSASRLEVRPPPRAGRVILVIIDALRADFWQHFVAAKRALVFQCIAGAPTITLPRLVTLVTGAEPSFARALRNFGGSASIVDEDSLVRQWHDMGSKIVFYGDDTWLRLFPAVFDPRSEGVSSFYVRDTVEVDNNVTQHLDAELRNTDWQVLILHYLGLDHAGHSYGPRHPILLDKLKEMDDLLLRLEASLKPDDVMLVTGDHGMTSTGNHGGNSRDEVSTLTMFFSPVLEREPHRGVLIEGECHQNDIAATISQLRGMRTPINCLGVPLPTVMQSWGISNWEKEALRRLQDWGRQNLLNWSAKDEASPHSLAAKLRSVGAGGHVWAMLCGLMGLVVAVLHLNSRPRSPVPFHTGAVTLRLALGVMMLSVLQVESAWTWLTCLYVCAVSVPLWSSISLARPQWDVVGALVSIGWLLVPFSSSLAEESYLFYFFAAQTLLLWSIERSNLQRQVATMMLLRFAHGLNPGGDKWRHVFGCDNGFVSPYGAVLVPFLTIALSHSRIRLLPSALLIACHAWWSDVVSLAWASVGVLLISLLLTRTQKKDALALISLFLQLVQHRNGSCFVIPVWVAHCALVCVDPKVSRLTLRVFSYTFTSFFGYSLSLSSVPLAGAYVFVSRYVDVAVFVTGYASISCGPILTGTFQGHLSASQFQREAAWAAMLSLSCAASAFMQRHHLFIWSVFGPLCLWSFVFLSQSIVKLCLLSVISF